jgi:hypothetical protein
VSATGLVTPLLYTGPDGLFITFTATSGCVTRKRVIIGPRDIFGPFGICLNTPTQYSYSGGGTWTSSNPAAISITSGGLATGNIIGGTAELCITDPLTGCTTCRSVFVTGQNGLAPTAMCVGATEELFPGDEGNWSGTSDPSIATVSVGRRPRLCNNS